MDDCADISDDGKNLWSNLLQDVKEKSSKRRHIPNSLLVLGNDLAGKSSLIARLQKADPKNGVGLEFEFIDVKDESMDENRQLNVWISSGDTFHSNLLKYALEENNFGFTLCIIMVSLTEPWAIMETLEQWLDILKKHIDRLKLDSRDLNHFKESLSRHFQEYVEPEVNTINTVVVGKRRDTDFNYLHPIANDDPEKILVPLGDSVFSKNLGIPIIIVLSKTDQFSTLEQDFQYDDDKFDFIQMHIRKLCLKYGAALCYTSLKDGRNCEMLLRYILHRCYGFPFIDTASVIEKDGVFIPAGWDNMNKINILADNLPEDIRNQPFDAFITKPMSLVRAAAQNRLTEPEMAEDEQVFLMKQQVQVQRLKAMANADPNAKPDQSRGPLPKGSSMATAGAGRSRKTQSGQSTAGANPANPGAQANEGVLANFFSSLLNKKGVAGGPPISNQQSVTSDPGKGVDNLSETEDSLKEELKAEDKPLSMASSVDEKSSPAHHPVNVESNLRQLDVDIIGESDVDLEKSIQKEIVDEKKNVEFQNESVSQGISEEMESKESEVVDEKRNQSKDVMKHDEHDVKEGNEGAVVANDQPLESGLLTSNVLEQAMVDQNDVCDVRKDDEELSIPIVQNEDKVSETYCIGGSLNTDEVEMQSSEEVNCIDTTEKPLDVVKDSEELDNKEEFISEETVLKTEEDGQDKYDTVDNDDADDGKNKVEELCKINQEEILNTEKPEEYSDKIDYAIEIQEKPQESQTELPNITMEDSYKDEGLEVENPHDVDPKGDPFESDCKLTHKEESTEYALEGRDTPPDENNESTDSKQSREALLEGYDKEQKVNNENTEISEEIILGEPLQHECDIEQKENNENTQTPQIEEPIDDIPEEVEVEQKGSQENGRISEDIISEHLSRKDEDKMEESKENIHGECPSEKKESHENNGISQGVSPDEEKNNEKMAHLKVDDGVLENVNVEFANQKEICADTSSANESVTGDDSLKSIDQKD